MNILAQRWFPIGDIGVGVSCLATLAQYWVSIGKIGIGFLLAPNNGIILVQHIGNRPATNIGSVIGVMLAQYYLKTNCLFKNSRVKKQQNGIPIH